MHQTKVKLKDGREFEAPILKCQPDKDRFQLIGWVEAISFNEIDSAVTEGERIGVIKDEAGNIIGAKIGDVDELVKAKRTMAHARMYGWFGCDSKTPLFDWEIAKSC